MIKIILILLVVSCTASFAKSAPAPLEVRFEKNKQVHIYRLEQKMESKKLKKFTLTFKATNKAQKKISISASQAQSLISEANQIIWKNEYRRPASAKSCTAYANVKTAFEKTQVCLENKMATGRAFGFMNMLGNLVQ